MSKVVAPTASRILVVVAILSIVAGMSGVPPALGQVAKNDDRVELILTNLPPRASRSYKALLALAGKNAGGQILPYTNSEMWSMPRSRVESVIRQAEALGVRPTRLGADWNHILKPGGPTAMSERQRSMVEKIQGLNATTGVNVMASPISPVVDYALHKDEGTLISATRPATAPPKIVIPLNDKESITARRTRVDRKKDGCTWHGEIEGTGEPVMLMWWKAGRFSGMFTYRGRAYYLKDIGGEVHAVVETDPGKMPPDHGAMHSQGGTRTQNADVKDDPLVARGEAAAARARDRSSAGDRKDLGGGPAQPEAQPGTDSPTPVKIEALSAAKRRAMVAKKITIDVMVLYTNKVAPHYIEIETDLLALSIEQANESLRNSGLANVKLALVHSQPIDYDESQGEHFHHLYRMVDGLGAFSKVRALRNEKRADVVVLIVDDASGCGLSTRVAADADEAFAVVHHSCAALSYSLAHEVAHIIGARHDLSLDQNMSPFPYGHGFVNGTKWRDVMSYKAGCGGCPRLPFFSNPTIKIKGEIAGALNADNARVILEQAERVSRFR
jgi:hypothetical protein